jgi:hypothetical protein
MPMESKMEERPVWHKPYIQQLNVVLNTAAPSIKTGSTEDIINQSNDWPAGVPFPEQ